MGPVEAAIRSAVLEGDTLTTPIRPKPFWVGRITPRGITLELGQQRTPTLFTWQCLEGILPLLREHGRIRINGTGKSTEIISGTLDGYLKKHVNRLTAGWIASILEKANVVIMDRSRPAFVRCST